MKRILCDDDEGSYVICRVIWAFNENDKKFPTSLFGQPDGFSLLTGTKFAVRLIELPFTLQHDREIVMFRFYFPFFIKLCMVLLCVIFKSE